MREKERQLEQERQARDQLSSRIRDMESKLLSGGKNIADRTNKQQRQLELSRQKISQQKVCGTCVWGRFSSFLLLWCLEGDKGCSREYSYWALCDRLSFPDATSPEGSD